MNKSNAPDKINKLAAFEKKINYIEQFITAKSLQQTNPSEMINICNSLI